ncbi:MAG: HAD-IB family hydrolase [Bacteroidota bacterium]|nr:HAD-IB family hydrolase [Bacteroidota bacterium]
MEITTSASNKPFSYIAFFDLDRTISKAISGNALALKAIGKGYMKTSDIATATWYGFVYLIGLGDSAKIMDKMAAWVKGLKEEILMDLCSEVVREIMIPSIHPEVIEEIRMHRANNAATVILSSTLGPVCRGIADHLQMDEIICSHLEAKNGYLTGKPLGKLCYGEEKLRRLNEYCEKNNTKPSESWYYADAFVDLPALELVGHPVCINPERKLARIARKKEWDIRRWYKGKKILSSSF